MKVLFTGTFNPFTVGHQSVYKQACSLFGKENVYIGLASNKNKKSLDTSHLKWVTNAITPNTVVIPEGSLVSDFCDKNGFNFVIRSMRNAIDLVYEMDMAHWNRKLGIQTVFIPCEEGLEKISSSIIRELHSYNKDISEFLPPFVYERWVNKPKRVLVTGRIASGKSSYMDWAFSKLLEGQIKDTDILAKEVLPLELRNAIRVRIEERLPMVEEDLNKSGKILYNKMMDYGPLIKVFEVSALGTYTAFDTNLLNNLYYDSVVINIERFDSGKDRVLDPTFKENILSIQKDPKVIDYVIDDRIQSRDEIQHITKKALEDIGCGHVF
jgi:pantetheine-phosphate adenylyltransferase